MKKFLLNALLWIGAALISVAISYENMNEPHLGGLAFFGAFLLAWAFFMR